MGQSRDRLARSRGLCLLFVAVLVVTGLDAGPALAQTPPPQASVPNTFKAPGFKEFPRALAINFTTGLFSDENLIPFVVGSTFSLLAHPFDESVSEAVTGDDNDFDSIGYQIGRPVLVAATTGALIAVTPFVKDERFHAFTFSLAQGVIVAQTLTEVIKVSADRVRPDGSNAKSFPSGHASGTFAVATVIAHYYGRTAGMLAYGVASGVALSRVDAGSHFLSDVVFGSTIGLVGGLTATRTSDRIGARRVAVIPYSAPGKLGINVAWRLDHEVKQARFDRRTH